MRSEPHKTESVGENKAQQFRRNKQDEFLLDDLQGIQEETMHDCDHNKELFEVYGYEDTNQHSFIIRRCAVCKQEMVVPEQYEDYESFDRQNKAN